MRLWDFIFAYFYSKGHIDCVDFITVAMMETMKEYIVQQIEISGVLQRLLKFNGQNANLIVQRAIELESSWSTYLGAFISAEISSPMKDSILPAPQIVKESKLGINKLAGNSDIVKTLPEPKPESETLTSGVTAKKIKMIEESLNLNSKSNSRQSEEHKTRHSSHSKEKKDQTTKEENLKTEIRSSKGLKDEVVVVKEVVNVQPSKTQSQKLVEYEGESDDQEEPMTSLLVQEKPKKSEDEKLEVVEEIKVKTITSKEENPFSNLIKKGGSNSQPKEVLVMSDEISKINSKVYSCISELQLEYMR